MNLKGLRVMQAWLVVRRLRLMGEEVTRKGKEVATNENGLIVELE
jgi:hypothetical protein